MRLALLPARVLLGLLRALGSRQLSRIVGPRGRRLAPILPGRPVLRSTQRCICLVPLGSRLSPLSMQAQYLLAPQGMLRQRSTSVRMRLVLLRASVYPLT